MLTARGSRCSRKAYCKAIFDLLDVSVNTRQREVARRLGGDRATKIRSLACIF